MSFGLAVFAIAFALWRQRPRTDQRMRLHEMMRLRGVQSLRSRDPAAARDAAAAERRCAACASKQMCDELLRTGDSEGYRRFCPNALYLEWLRSNSLHFD
jgi:uncharacterized protein DUF6455